MQAKVTLRLDDAVPPLGWTPPEDWEPGDAVRLETTPGPRAVQRGAARGLPVRRLRGRQEAAVGDRQRPGRALPEGPGRGDAGRPQGERLPLGDPGRRHDLDRRRRHPAAQERDPRELRGSRGQGAGPVREGPDHRRRAAPGAHRDLDPRHQRGRRGDGGELPLHEPGLDDGPLRRPREHDAGPADRRHAWSGGEPEGRDHPAADQGQLPRGPVRAGVLHLHARRPQGSGRHRSAHRRLRLPDPPAGRRLAGRHHPGGRLRHRPRPHLPGVGTAVRRRVPGARRGRGLGLRADAGGRRGRRRRHGGRRGRLGRDHGPHRPDGRGRHRRGEGPQRPDLREQGQHLRAVLRAVAGDRQARGRRRGGRHHRRPVDRRARHPADHADVPHRRRRR